jgi:predicted aspartyl protease
MTTLLLANLLAHYPLTAPVWIGGRGPFEFLVDTGAETTSVDPRLAQELGLAPRYRVELITPSGSRSALGRDGVPLSWGTAETPPKAQEVIWHDLESIRRAKPGLRGILGLNALLTGPVLFHPAGGRTRPAAAPPEGGHALPYESESGRIVIAAQADGRPVRLTLDSGASNLVLFQSSRTAQPDRQLRTSSGSVAAGTLRLRRLSAGPCEWIGVEAAVFASPQGTDGLLPLTPFDWVYLDPARRLLLVKPLGGHARQTLERGRPIGVPGASFAFRQP